MKMKNIYLQSIKLYFHVHQRYNLFSLSKIVVMSNLLFCLPFSMRFSYGDLSTHICVYFEYEKELTNIQKLYLI